MQRNVPYDKDVRDAPDGVPAPPLHSTFFTVRGEQTREDHDEVGDDGHERVRAVDAGEQAQVQQEQRRGNAPVDVARPEDLAAHVMVRIRHARGLPVTVAAAVVVVGDGGAVVRGGVARGHGEVRHRGREGDERGHDVVEALLHGHVPRQGGEDGRGDRHDHEDDPEGAEAVGAGLLELGRVGWASTLVSMGINVLVWEGVWGVVGWLDLRMTVGMGLTPWSPLVSASTTESGRGIILPMPFYWPCW